MIIYQEHKFILLIKVTIEKLELQGFPEQLPIDVVGRLTFKPLIANTCLLVCSNHLVLEYISLSILSFIESLLDRSFSFELLVLFSLLDGGTLRMSEVSVGIVVHSPSKHSVFLQGRLSVHVMEVLSSLAITKD